MIKPTENNQGRIPGQIKKLTCALQFLTVLPVAHDHSSEKNPFDGVVYYFVVAGALIGGMASAIYWTASYIFPPSITAAITIIFFSAISGFIHLDGLADTADGFLSNKEREACLEIMRDSRVGVMGAVAIVIVLLLKYSVLADQETSLSPAALLLIPISGRAAIVYSMALLPYARSSGGLGMLFYTHDLKKAALLSFAVLCLGALLLSPVHFLVVALVPVVSAVSFSRYCRMKIGGATGDTLGAVCEITETMVLITMSLTFLH